jgi:hypothetical protein
MSEPGSGAPRRRAALPAVPFGQQATEPLPTAGDPAPGQPPPLDRTAALPVLPPADAPGFPAGTPSFPPDLPAARRGPLVPLLAAASALLLVAVVVLAALVVTAEGDLDRARAEAVASDQEADTRARELAAARDEVTGLKRDMARARDDLAATKKELTGAKSLLGVTETDKQVVSNCLRLILQFFDAAGAGDGEGARRLLAEANKPCEDADAIANPS